MKQMNKEELIEFFLEQLGDNEILGKVMSKEKIKAKLEDRLREITFNPELGRNIASWNIDEYGKRNLNFDLEKILKYADKEQYQMIVHELLHILSTSIIRCRDKEQEELQFVKCGLVFSCQNVVYPIEESNYHEKNRAINEGMTDSLAEQITGGVHDGYIDEKNVYQILSVIIGEDILLYRFFEDIDEQNYKVMGDITVHAPNVLKSDIIRKYGAELGVEINDVLIKVLSLLDDFHNLRNTDGVNKFMSRRNKIMSEIDETLMLMLSRVIDNEPDIMNKINNILLPCFQTKFSERIANKILSELVKSKYVEYDEKLTILRSVRQARNSIIPASIIDNMLFDESTTLSAQEKLDYYLELYTGETYDLDFDRLYDLYVESGMISKQIFTKRTIFKIVGYTSRTIDELNVRIDKIRHCKVGDYHMMCGGYIQKNGAAQPIDRKMFDNGGNEVRAHILYLNPTYDEITLHEHDLKEFLNIVREEEIPTLIGQLKEKGKEFKKNVLDIKKDKNYDEYFMSVAITGNLIRIKYISDISDENDNGYYEFYSVNSMGQLEQIEIRRRTKIYRRYVSIGYRVTKPN